jgi:hypothetical protein
MTKLLGWRGLLTCATIDALLVLAAGTAWAAPTAPVPAATPTLSVLLVLGVGLVSAGWPRRAAG